MELKKINYATSISFGVIAWIISLIFGLYIFGVTRMVPGQVPSPFLTTVVGFPLLSGAIYLVLALLVIATYNLVARKYPISWNIK